MKNQKYYKCSCELFIEEFKVSHLGFLYFIWICGDKQTQTLKYDTNTSKFTQIGQTLSLNLTFTTKNNKFMPKITNLFLLNDMDEQLDDIELNASDWTQTFKQVNIPIGGGSIHAKIRRKQIMQVSAMQDESEQNFQQTNVKISADRMKIQTHEQLFVKTGQKSFYGKQQKFFVNGQINSQSSQNMNQQILQELGRVKKQLQDNVYLNNKLKNDRDVLMKRQQSLQFQIQSILITVSQDLKNMREHHDKRISIREQIYEEEIEQMIVMVNGNSEYSRKVIEQLLRQKAKLEQENRLFGGQLQKTKRQLSEYKLRLQNDLRSLNQQLSLKIQQHQKEKQEQVRKAQDQLKIKTQEIDSFKSQILKEKQEIQNQLENYKIQFQKSRVNNVSLEDQLMEQVKRNQQKSIEIQTKVMEIQKAGMNMRALSEMLQAQQKLIAQLKGELQSQKNQSQQSAHDIINLNAQILEKDERFSQLQAQLQEITYELQFNEDAHKQLKVQHQEKEQQLYNQLQNIQAIYNDKMQQFAKKLHDKLEQLSKDNNELRQKLGMSEKQLSEIQSQLLQKQSEIQNIRDSSQRGGGEHNHELKKLESQKSQLKRQFQERLRIMERELEKRDEELAQRVKQLQDQLHITQKKKQQSDIKLKTYAQQLQMMRNGQSKGAKARQQPATLNRSIQISRVQGLQSSREQISLGPIKGAAEHPLHYEPGQIQEALDKKQQQIHRLNNRIEELNGWCNSLQTKLREAHSMKLVEYCQSQKNEQEEVNLNEKKKQAILNNLQTLQKVNKSPKNNLVKNGDNSQIFLDEANFGYTPKNQSYLKRRQSMGMSKDLSQHSNTSYIRVSHSQKIKMQQQLINQMEERQSQYKAEVQAYTKKIQDLTNDIDKIKKQMEEYMMKPQINESTLNELETLRNLNNHNKEQLEEKNHLLTQFKQEINQLRPELQHLRGLKPQLQSQLKQVNKTCNQMKQLIMQLEIKLKDCQRRLQMSEQTYKKSNTEIQNLNKIIAQLQQKIRQHKEHEQELRMQNRQLMFVNEQTTNQMKKYKSLYQQLEEKLKKYAGSDVTIKEMQKQIEEWNKRNLEQVRQSNHMKLEKDSIEEQMKLIKKRHGEQTRVAIEWEEKASGLERVIDQYKRKQSKFKRQAEQSQEEVRKTRSQMKKLEEQLHTFQTLSTSFNYQKKKYLDELAQKGDQITRKEYENNRLLKQLQKFRHKIQQSQDNRLGRKNQLRFQIEKLQADAIKKDKRILQMEEEDKMLKSRLEFLEKQNTKIMEKKTQTYGDKLKHYIDEIASIKKLLDEYQTENTKLKIQNNEFYQQNQLLKLSFSKLQKKYEQNIDNEQNILTDLQHYMDELNLVSQKNRQYELQLDHLEQSYAQIKKQLDDQKIQNKKKNERLQSAEKANGQLMDQVKDLKIKLSELQTDTKIHFNINEKYRNLDRKKTQIQEQLKRIRQEYDSYKNAFVYKQDDVQKLFQDIKNSERRQKQQQMAQAIEEITKANSLRNNKFQAELMQMFNQNSKLRDQLSLKAQQLAKTKLLISELQTMIHKVLSLQSQIRQLTEQVCFNKQQTKRRNDKISKDQVYIKELQTRIQSKQVQFVDSLNRINDLEMKIEKLNNKIAVLQSNQEALQDKIRELIHRQKQAAQNNIINQQSSQTNPNSKQNIERKVFQLQLQLAKSKQRQNSLTTQYNGKIKSLESKLQEMSQTMAEHQKQIQKHYENQLYKSEESILKLSEELEDKLIRIDELNEAIIVVQQENQQMAKELSNTRYKLDEETQIFNIEYSKLKQKLKQSEQVYNQNLKSLQNELTSMGKQLSLAKYNRNSDPASGSRLKSSEIQDSKKAVKRVQEKLKIKDKKIQELKSNIYILEETVLKLRKKQSSNESISTQYQSMRTECTRLDQQLKQHSRIYQIQLKGQADLIRDLKQQVLQAKQGQEQAKINLEERIMEFTSMESELKTMKELYSELQKEIDRRKLNLSNQMQQQSLTAIELRNKESQINDLKQKMEQLNMNMASYMTENKKLSQQCKLQSSQVKQMASKQQNYYKQLQESQNCRILIKKQLQQLRQKNMLLEAQTKSIRLQLQKMKRFYEQSKIQLGKAYEQIQNSNKGTDQISMRLKQYQQIVSKFKRLQQISVKQIGVSLQQLIEEGYFMETLQQKQNEINQLIQEVQQLKFLSDRKLLDYDELKRENYELTLKAEDNQIINEQVQNLRRICDKLEEEKKQAVFKQELIKMHLGNLIESSQQDDDSKRKIEHILRSVATMNQMGAVSFGESSFGNY